MMSKLFDFFTEPVEQPTNTEGANQQASSETPGSDSTDATPDAGDLNITDSNGIRFEEEDAIQRKHLDEVYWPYAFTPDGPTENIGINETLQIGTTEDGKEDAFAGQWVREMFEAHELQRDDNTWVGYSHDNVRGVQEAGIEYKSLFRHMAFFGVTGYGKSTVLKNIMFQWAAMGHGFCYIDPKGQDILELVSTLPEDRLDDIVWVEPGNEKRDYSVGFNFFDTAKDPGDTGFENEVQEIVNDFVSILQASVDGWGATMDAVSKAVSQQLVRAEENYTLLDMYKILSDEDEREKFAEEFGDEVQSIFLDRLKEYETEEIDPLLRRLREWSDNKNTREVIAHDESTVNISDIVEEGKIMLVRTSDIAGNDVKSMIATTIVRRIWSKIRTRSDQDPDDLDPYFIVMDEFDMLVNDKMDFEDMLSKGRSLRLSVCVANQQISQLPEEIMEAINGNCDNQFTFNPGDGNVQDAKQLKNTFDVEMMDLFELSEFELLGRFKIDGKKTDPILVQTFAPYPPRRKEETTQEIIKRSAKRYGTKRDDDNEGADFSQFGLLAREREEQGEELIEVGDDKLSTSQILEAVHTAGVRHGTRVINEKPGWVDIEGIRKEAIKYSDGFEDGAHLDNILEKIPATLREEATVGETTYYRLTTEGEEMAFVQDTGNSASGGKAGHRHLLKKGYEAFTQLGYDVRLPTQEGGEQPDGVAEPPIKPVEESDSFEEAQRLEEKLEQKYPRLQELFGDNEVALEAESTTITKPKQTVKNLSKAMRNDQKCVFLVKDGEESKGKFEYWARAGYRVLNDPPFVSYKDADGNRRYYNYAVDSPVKLKNGGYALREASNKDTVWRDDGDRIVLENPENKLKHTQTDVKYTYSYTQNGEIILRDPDGNEYKERFDSWNDIVGQGGDFEETQIPLAIFKDRTDLEEPSHTKFPYHYEYDQSKQHYIVRDSNGNDIDTFEDKKDLLDEYDIIPKPLIPEAMFPGGEYPDEDDWLFVVVPDANKDIGPQIYRGEDQNGDPILEPLFENDDPYDAIKNEDLPENDTENVEADDSKESESVEDATTDDTDDDDGGRPDGLITSIPGGPDEDDEEDDDEDEEVPVASGDNPSSTNDVVKESSEVWTKPEEGDDDYNPAKDPKNFDNTRDEYRHDHGDGGLAREEDKNGGMDGYKTPEEKEDERLKEDYKNRNSKSGEGSPEDADDAPVEPSPDEVAADAADADGNEESDADDEAEDGQASDDTDEDADEEESASSTDPLNSLSKKRNRRRRKKREADDEDE